MMKSQGKYIILFKWCILFHYVVDLLSLEFWYQVNKIDMIQFEGYFLLFNHIFLRKIAFKIIVEDISKKSFLDVMEIYVWKKF